MDSMAAVATSAALPWMGVLMAARRACACCKGQHAFICQDLLELGNAKLCYAARYHDAVKQQARPTCLL